MKDESLFKNPKIEARYIHSGWLVSHGSKELRDLAPAYGMHTSLLQV